MDFQNNESDSDLNSDISSIGLAELDDNAYSKALDTALASLGSRAEKSTFPFLVLSGELRNAVYDIFDPKDDVEKACQFLRQPKLYYPYEIYSEIGANLRLLSKQVKAEYESVVSAKRILDVEIHCDAPIPHGHNGLMVADHTWNPKMKRLNHTSFKDFWSGTRIPLENVRLLHVWVRSTGRPCSHVKTLLEIFMKFLNETCPGVKRLILTPIMVSPSGKGTQDGGFHDAFRPILEPLIVDSSFLKVLTNGVEASPCFKYRDLTGFFWVPKFIERGARKASEGDHFEFRHDEAYAEVQHLCATSHRAV